MRVSVLIPAYNAERYVAEAVASVLAQDPPPAEVIVVDDGSTDRTADVLAGFGDRILLLRQANGGPAAALNLALAHATGDLLAFNDADDLWMPGRLAMQVGILAGNPDLEAVFGHVRLFTSPDFDAGPDGAPGDGDILPGISKLGLVIRRSAFERISLFDASLRAIDFIDWYARAFAMGLRSLVIPDIVGLRRLHATNTGRTRRQEQHAENLVALKRLLDRRRGRGSGA